MDTIEEWKRRDVERALGVRFKNEAVLLQAFTRKSYLNEHKDSMLESYQRLEFLGDAVVGLMAADYFLHKCKGREKELTDLRKNVINKTTLAKAARKIGLGNYLLVSRSEKLKGEQNDELLEDCFEAVTGAMFLNRGYGRTERFLIENLFTTLG